MADKISSQMLKGTLTGSILLLLSREELYGYKLSEQLEQFGFAEISKGTIYPLLLSLEKKGLIVGNMRPSDNGPKRKYYSLTKEGCKEKEAFLKQWKTLKNNMAKLIERTDADENK
ncbi:PadR family transcriptional regulator [Tetragenococcus solitarius]|uniref:PadR family transcriptional regulator n=1 Tax=Tetragenococcus solitarius TaxID=71453 RepID=A0ABN3YD23_9ENTE|nr:PadR family transcriptional regulator [Tetragenococcus solitarius]